MTYVDIITRIAQEIAEHGNKEVKNMTISEERNTIYIDSEE